MDKLIASFNKQKIVHLKKATYLITPLLDHVGATDPVVLHQAVNAICDVVDWYGSDPITKIVSEEERGGFIAVAVALQRNLSFSLAKQNPVKIPGQVGVTFNMSYNDKMTLYLNGLSPKDKVIIIDDMIDSGGTIIALINAVRRLGAMVKDVVVLMEKVGVGGVKKIQEKTGILPKAIIQVDCSGKKSKVVGTIFDQK